MRIFSFLLVVVLGTYTAMAGDNLMVGGDFEEGMQGWRGFWSRAGQGKAVLDNDVAHSGRQALRVEHPGGDDWSVQQGATLPVVPGEIYGLAGFLRVQGKGTATLCVILYDKDRNALSWTFGDQTVSAADDWQPVKSRFLIPPAGAMIVARVIGAGPATVWADDLSLRRAGSLADLRGADLPESVSAKNEQLEVRFDTATAALTLTDRRTGEVRKQTPADGVAVLRAKEELGRLTLRLLEPRAMRELEVSVELVDGVAEAVVEIASKGEMEGTLAFPAPFESKPGEFLILPVNEGISYPVDDESLPEMNYYLYGGHGLCMGWYGSTDTKRALLTIVETPDDAAVRLPRIDGRLVLAPQWQPQKGQFGPSRRIRYVLFESGGYVAMCKRYREYAKDIGLLKTLAQKRQENPNVDKLVGAANIWSFGPRGPEMCREMQGLGIDRILWSARSKPDEIDAMNAMGVLTSRYDIFQDCMNPANFDKLRGLHGDWTSDAWPDGIMLDAKGDWIRGWRVEGKDGEMYPCGVLCDRLAPDYARRRIPPELETHSYQCRFIDTTTASPWRECYSEAHPLTRSESRHWKMELLRVISEELDLVTGSETGHEAAVPYVHYFEGMLSLGPYRVPDAGRRMLEPWDEAPERVAKFQTGPYYRLPLWELVYHDCVVAQWYWGDYNNKLPKLWDRRDLINTLYGTPPMFMFDAKIWQGNRDRFVKSYKAIAPVARATGYREMLSHEWLTEDHTVQQTRFAGGVTVTVNFGEEPYRLEGGESVAPTGCCVQGLP
ncbi:MAG: hypothetical protein GXX96_10560 [Planctomycetaceae bacterium]|nr:hypothetical protein [Planctomycetaceae bacterium]